MVEIQLEKDIPQGLLIAFSVMTTILISVHVFALMISVCILPNIDGVANIHQQGTQVVRDSPHEKLHIHDAEVYAPFQFRPPSNRFALRPRRPRLLFEHHC